MEASGSAQETSGIAQEASGSIQTETSMEFPAMDASLSEWDARLAKDLEFDAGKQRMLEALLEGNEELRKQNIELELENRRLQHTLDLDSRRHREQPKEESFSDAYDWVVDIQLLSDVSKQGWRVAFSGDFLQTLDVTSREQLLSGRDWMNDDGVATADGLGRPQAIGWRGAVVAVLGLYDKGKTFVLNNLTESKLPSGKKVATKGLSFKHVEVEGGTRFVLLDSEGSYSPVKVLNELSVVEKEATELFLQELIFEMSDYFLCVVNDFTSLDQRYLDKLTRNLQSSKKDFREVIVVHNCKEVIDEDTLRHVWETQVTAIYGAGTPQSTLVAAVDPNTGTLVEKAVGWFKTPFSRHVLLANADSDLGEQLNPWGFSLLRYWLKSVFVPVSRDFSVVDAVVHFSNQKLTTHFKAHPQLALVQSEEEPGVSYIRSLSDSPEALRLHQVAVDASGIMLARPDSYLPPVDIIRDVDGAYVIYMDLPGMTRDQIKISRQNVVTIVKGTRDPDHTEKEIATAVTRQERKTGDFTMTFRIPEEYQRKWDSATVENGVLCVRYLKDTDEEEA
jgi:HSP20 family molecular chaperone IbpA